jgi:cell wall assembly regulator SMI1
MSDEYSVCPVCGSNSGQGCTADCTAAEITKLRAEVFWLRQGMSAKLSDHMNGTPCAEIRWQHERETLQAEVERLTSEAGSAYADGVHDGGNKATEAVHELLKQKDATIARLTAALELWMDAVRIDATMEGPQYMGAGSTLGRKVAEATLAALQQEPHK